MSASSWASAALAAEVLLVRYSQAGTRNEALNRAAFNLGQIVGGGDLKDQEVEEALLDAALIAGLGEAEATLAIHSGLLVGCDLPRVRPPQVRDRAGALGQLVEITAAADRVGWSGRDGQSELMVLHASLAIGRAFGGPGDLPLSVDRLALYAGTKSRGRVWRGRWDLVEDGWLRPRSPGGPRKATRYSLRIPSSLVRSGSSTKQHSPGSPVWTHNAKEGNPFDDVGHDAFARAGLDKLGFRIIRHLAANPGWHSQSEVAKSLGVTAGTVCRRVQPAREGPYGISLSRRRALVSSGVVERNQHGALRLRPGLRPEDLNAVAHYFGTAGTRDEHRVALRQRYEAMGWLTEDCRWIDASTGESGALATWLLPTGSARAEKEEFC